MTDSEVLIRDKYEGIEPSGAELDADLERLACGEPLAYVIGWIPFLGLRICLDSHPLIPRPETEWWTNELIAHLKKRFRQESFHFLDLCAGSGAIGLAVLKEFPDALVSFAEIVPEHLDQIEKNIEENNLDRSRAELIQSDVLEGVVSQLGDFQLPFNVIASNPPYIPSERRLDESVISFEPPEALFAGSDGLSIIRRIAENVQWYLFPEGELWLEADIDNVGIAKTMLDSYGAARSEIRTDQYGRERFVVSYYP